MSQQMFTKNDSFINRINAATQALRAGKGVILIDDDHRENEGDLIFPAETITQTQVNQLIQDCSGIVCLCMTPKQAQHLNLNPMVLSNTSQYQTAFTISIEAKVGVTTGVSAHDRLITIQTAVRDNATADDLSRPGHIFPLIAKEHGVFERRGHTEGSVDLMTIAGYKPSAVLCELMNPDGTMKNLSQLIDYAEKQQYPILTIEDIYQYKKHQR